MTGFFVDLWQIIRKHYKFLISSLLIVVGALIIYDLVFYTTSVYAPKTCAVCHYEKSLVNRWRNSYHSGVSCSKCHDYKPGFFVNVTWKYLTGDYSMHVNPEINDRSCLKCHGEEILKQKITYKENIKFDHTLHVNRLARNIKLHCSSCHNFSTNQSHLSVNDQTCFLCHFQGVAKGQAFPGCPSCHGTPKKIIRHEGFVFDHRTYVKAGITCNECHVNVAEGDGHVKKQTCRKCHIERTAQFNDPAFIHQKHVTENQIECLVCHTPIRHGDIQLVNTLEVQCTSCHQTMHGDEKEMYMGAGAKEIPDRPSRMFLAQVSCAGCHPKLSGIRKKFNRAKDIRQKKQACVRCHGAHYDKMLGNWIVHMNRLVKEVGPKVSRVGDLVKKAKASGKLSPGLQQQYAAALYNFNFVKNGRGVHNIFYAVDLLKSTKRNLEKISKELHAAPPVFHDPILTTRGAFCTTFCHTIVKPPKSVMFEQIDFSHEKHVEKVGLECTRCHSPKRHRQRTITKQECMNCHHREETVSCATCHVYQTELYTGEVKAAGITDEPDVMRASGIGCTDCHDLKDKRKVLISVAEKCADCHEPAYKKILRDWHNDLQQRLTETFVALQSARSSVQTSDLSNVDKRRKMEILDSAAKMYTVLEKGKPVHNPDVANEIMDKINEQIKKIGVESK
ncbi:class III cytochrome C family protein [bacterium BMS3Abin05]|nr:class III cytochrome C family protein [bacterium BMS3Abin05]GBE27340.1 class III cytochrome C family protein [bacterium BMS3Bbin03]HDZ13241.1 hypothetical protein [Bacteroidota bacterium]